MSIFQACCGPSPAAPEDTPFPFKCSFPESGRIFYKDDYGTLNEVVWESTLYGTEWVLDFTVVTKQPYVWGEVPEGFVRDKIVYRRGVCTVWRYIMGPHEDGYEIIAEGASQVICVFPTNFICEEQPADNFIFHLDSYICDDIEFVVDCGSRFYSIEEPGSAEVVFYELAPDGTVIPDPSVQGFQFVSVWDQTDSLTAVCEPGTGVISAVGQLTQENLAVLEELNPAAARIAQMYADVLMVVPSLSPSISPSPSPSP